jgi:hypothetical protein
MKIFLLITGILYIPASYINYRLGKYIESIICALIAGLMIGVTTTLLILNG